MDPYATPRNNVWTPYTNPLSMYEHPEPDMFARPIPIHDAPPPHLDSDPHFFHPTPYHPPPPIHIQCSYYTPRSPFPPLIGIPDPSLHLDHHTNRHVRPAERITPQIQMPPYGDGEFEWRYPDFSEVFGIERDIEPEARDMSPLGHVVESSGDEGGSEGEDTSDLRREREVGREVEGYRPGYAETIIDDEEYDGDEDDGGKDMESESSVLRHLTNGIEVKTGERGTSNLDVENPLPRLPPHTQPPPWSDQCNALREWEHRLHQSAAAQTAEKTKLEQERENFEQEKKQLETREQRFRRQERRFALARQRFDEDVMEIRGQYPCRRRVWGRDEGRYAWMGGDGYELSGSVDEDGGIMLDEVRQVEARPRHLGIGDERRWAIFA